MESARIRRSGDDFKLVDALALLSMDGTQAIGAGVATADDDDMFAASRDERGVVDRDAGHPPILGGQELHGKMDPIELASLDRQVARLRRASTEADGVELVEQLLGVDIETDVDLGSEDDPLGFHLLETTVQVPLFHLEVGNAVTEQTADAVIALEDSDRVTGSGELLRGGQSGRARAYDRHLLAGRDLGRLWDDPALVPGAAR